MGNGNNKTYEHLITEWFKLKFEDENISFREILYRLHYLEYYSYRDIAELLKVSLSTVYYWFKREGLIEKDMKW